MAGSWSNAPSADVGASAPLERTFTAEFRDLVVLARQLAEAGVLFSHVADAPTGFDVTTILNPFSTSRVNEFDDTVLKKRR